MLLFSNNNMTGQLHNIEWYGELVIFALKDQMHCSTASIIVNLMKLFGKAQTDAMNLKQSSY